MGCRYLDTGIMLSVQLAGEAGRCQCHYADYLPEAERQSVRALALHQSQLAVTIARRTRLHMRPAAPSPARTLDRRPAVGRTNTRLRCCRTRTLWQSAALSGLIGTRGFGLPKVWLCVSSLQLGAVGTLAGAARSVGTNSVGRVGSQIAGPLLWPVHPENPVGQPVAGAPAAGPGFAAAEEIAARALDPIRQRGVPGATILELTARSSALVLLLDNLLRAWCDSGTLNDALPSLRPKHSSTSNSTALILRETSRRSTRYAGHSPRSPLLQSSPPHLPTLQCHDKKGQLALPKDTIVWRLCKVP